MTSNTKKNLLWVFFIILFPGYMGYMLGVAGVFVVAQPFTFFALFVPPLVISNILYSLLKKNN
jgi:hypothetical protein